MKNSALNLLRGGVFLMALVAAFAFTVPHAAMQDEFAQDPETGEPINVSSLQIGVDYDCNPGVECTFDAQGNTLREGEFAWREQ